MHGATQFRPHVPANKFSPPRLAENRMFIRSSLLDRHLGQSQPYQYVFLEAQPGQGKTTTAIQFLAHSGSPYVWYQVGKEDRDPLFFFTALLQGLHRISPEFSCPRLAGLLESGELTHGEISRPVDFLFSDLEQVLSGECTLVFDDLHLLADAEQSLGIIDYMLETAPPNISFMLLSRKPLPLKSKRLRYGGSTLYLSNEQLAFSAEEIGTLLELLLGRTQDTGTITELLSQTSGWPMGVVLAARNHKGMIPSVASSLGNHDGAMHSYFEEELFDQLEQGVQQILIKLALLDDIVISLAGEITEEPEIGAILLQLMEENCFVRSLDDAATSFSFHHLFRDLLRHKAKQLLTVDEYQKILRQGAEYCLKQGIVAKGMHYLLRAESYSELELLFQERGMELLAMNRLLTLGSVLDQIPQDRVQNSAWFSFFSGLVLEKSDSMQSLECFVRARILFQEEKNIQGELLVLGELIYFHVLLSPDYDSCVEYLDSGNRLFKRCGAALPPFWCASTAKNLSGGYFYFLNDFKKSLDYGRIGEQAASETDSPSQLLEILVSRGFVYQLRGDYHLAEDTAEQVYEIMTSGNCGLLGMAVGYCFLLQVIYLKRDYRGYQRLKQVFTGELEKPEALSSTIVQFYIVLYDITIAAAVGDLDQAVLLLNTHVDSGFFAAHDHLRNEMLAAKVLVWAQAGLFEPEGRELAEALLPAAMGGEGSLGYRSKLLLPLALAFALAGEVKKGRRLVGEVLLLSGPLVCYRIDALLFRAFFATLDGDMETAHSDLQMGLEKMQQQRTGHFAWITPVEMLAILRLAVKLDVCREFARQMAAEHLDMALADDGSSLALMTVTTLGSFEIRIADRFVARAADFTVTQRQLLGLLISHPQQQVSQELIQFSLWPDSSTSKGRNRFDALLSRLRKTLTALLPGHKVKDYLVLEKGLLSLKNCRIDAHRFIELVSGGLALGREQKRWRAGNLLASAMDLCSGPFVADLLPGDPPYQFRQEILDSLMDLALFWCPVLAERGQLEEAVRVAARIWKESPDNEQLTRLLYGLHMQNNDQIQARKLCSRYTVLLEKGGYRKGEIQELLARVVK